MVNPRQAFTPDRIVLLIAYAVLGIGILILFAQNARQDEFDDRREADIAAAVNAAQDKTIHCVVKALRSDAAQTKELRDAVQLKDADLAAAMKAMVVLVQERVLDGNPTSPAIRQAADQFITQAGNFLTESEKVLTTREANPVPNKICGVVIQ